MRNIVIIGNSAAGLKALETFRQHDPVSPVTLVSKEEGPAYSRVLLPYFLRQRIPYENLFIRTAAYYREMNVTAMFNTAVRQVEHEKQHIVLENGRNIHFDTLLIAAGAHPVKPPVENIEGSGVFHLWTLRDARDIEPRLIPGNRVLVLGSGFVALQAAWAARQRGLNVTVCELMDRIMPKVLDAGGAEALHRKIEEHGGEIRTRVLTEGIQRLKDGSIRVYQKGFPPFDVDLIIVGTGVRPNVDFLEGVAIDIGEGITVNSRMESSISSIYAAGDIASGRSAFGEDHITHALWPTAVEHGRVAGANMAGEDTHYRGSLNMNVTEMFGTTVASMGVFHDEEGLAPIFPEGQPDDSYLKILMREENPVGAVLIGDAEGVKTLGNLRAVIRGTSKHPATHDIAGDLKTGRPVFHRFIA